MSVKVASNRLINFSSKWNYLGFYQQLIGRLSSFQELGSRLVIEAEIAQAQRQIDKVDEIGLLLSNLYGVSSPQLAANDCPGHAGG